MSLLSRPAQGKSVCIGCGSANPQGVQQCVTCERCLPTPPPPPSPPCSPPPPTPSPLPTPSTMRPVSGRSFMMCGGCGRVNVSDARFCDWCGSKVSHCELTTGAYFETSSTNICHYNSKDAYFQGVLIISSLGYLIEPARFKNERCSLSWIHGFCFLWLFPMGCIGLVKWHRMSRVRGHHRSNRSLSGLEVSNTACVLPSRSSTWMDTVLTPSVSLPGFTQT